MFRANFPTPPPALKGVARLTLTNNTATRKENSILFIPFLRIRELPRLSSGVGVRQQEQLVAFDLAPTTGKPSSQLHEVDGAIIRPLGLRRGRFDLPLVHIDLDKRPGSQQRPKRLEGRYHANSKRQSDRRTRSFRNQEGQNGPVRECQ
jgi:hypothetical protein